MKINTTRFGDVEVEEDKIIHFPRGVIGFKSLTRFCMLPFKEPVQWLQAVDDPDVAFIVCDPFALFTNYGFKVEDFVEEYLDCKEIEDIVVFVLLVVENNQLFANLRSPILVNSANMKAAHLFIADESVSMKALVEYPPGSKSSCGCGCGH
ncbi:MAG: flagellar assembly protein FliW [Candidatus Magnetominusculus sp. LBB02]|nr:flagellar assembly protein FliW [Candidatus Magnetominusculus sp. LBB02]